MGEPPPSPLGKEVWICATCRRTLNTYIEYDDDNTITGFHWLHPADEAGDHEPIPVREDQGLEMRTKCDFCGGWGTEWTFPCRDFVVDEPHTVAEEGYGSRGDWASCADCKRLIEAGYYDRLLNRALRIVPRHQRTATRGFVRRLHQGFRANRLGPLFPTKV